MASLFSLGKEILLILTLSCVSSCRSQSKASKENASTRYRIALAVALPGVEESCVDVVVARIRRPPLVETVKTNGRCCLPPLLLPRPRPRVALGVRDFAWMRSVTVFSAGAMCLDCKFEGTRMIGWLSGFGKWGRGVLWGCRTVGLRDFLMWEGVVKYLEIGRGVLGRGVEGLRLHILLSCFPLCPSTSRGLTSVEMLLCMLSSLVQAPG